MTEPKKPRQAAIFFILITIFIDVLGIGIIIPILPELIKQFVGGDASLASRYVGVISASYAIMQFFFAPVLGALSDRFGRRKVILISLFGLSIDYLIQGFAPTVGWLFLGRVIAGIMGASFTTANAYIADISTARNRAQNFGLIGVAFGLGFVLGPSIGGLLGAVDLRLPFFASAGLAMVNWLYGFFVLPESLAPENRDVFDLRKALNPLSNLRNLGKYPLVGGMALAYLCLGLAQRGLENVWVLSTGYRFGWDVLTNGLVLGLVGIMSALVQGGLIRPFIARFGERTAVRFGLSVATLSFLGYGLATQGWMIVVIIIFGSLGGLALPAIQGIVAGTVLPSEQGKIQGGLTSLMSLTNIVAPLIFTAGVFGYFTSEAAPVHFAGAPFVLGGILNGLGLIVMVRLFRRLPESPASEGDGDAETAAPPLH